MMGASAIREILKVVSQPGMIFLAGGIPAPESFPMEIICDLTTTVIERYSSAAFQYDLTEGFMPLREALVGKAHGRVLEIGVGSGRNLPLYPREIRVLYGIDPSIELLERARKEAAWVHFPASARRSPTTIV